MFLKYIRHFDAHEWARALGIEPDNHEASETASKSTDDGGSKLLRVTYIDRQNTLRSLPRQEHEWIMNTMPSIPDVVCMRARVRVYACTRGYV